MAAKTGAVYAPITGARRKGASGRAFTELTGPRDGRNRAETGRRRVLKKAMVSPLMTSLFVMALLARDRIVTTSRHFITMLWRLRQ